MSWSGNGWDNRSDPRHIMRTVREFRRLDGLLVLCRVTFDHSGCMIGEGVVPKPDTFARFPTLSNI